MITIKKKNKIDELNLDGYKEIAKTEWGLPENLEKWLIERNFEEIGSGYYSKIFSSKTESFVVKVNKGKIDQEYLKYIDFCLSHKGNSHLPKISKPKMLDDWYIIFIEELDPIVDSVEELGIYDDDMMEYFKNYIYGRISDYSYKYFEELWEKIKEENEDVTEQLPDVAEVLFTAMNYCRFSYRNLDLHIGNVMMRDKTLVLTDPFWNGA